MPHLAHMYMFGELEEERSISIGALTRSVNYGMAPASNYLSLGLISRIW